MNPEVPGASLGGGAIVVMVVAFGKELLSSHVRWMGALAWLSRVSEYILLAYERTIDIRKWIFYVSLPSLCGSLI